MAQYLAKRIGDDHFKPTRYTMIIDARKLNAGDTIKSDICIVGAGAAGLTVTKELIGQGVDVCLLESGGFETDQETQQLYHGENIGLPYFPLEMARARYFGGSCNRWHIDIGPDDFGARLRPFDRIDFEKRIDIPHSGWPFNKSHLNPYYDRAQSICNVEPTSYDINDWERASNLTILCKESNSVESVIFKIGSKSPFVNDYIKEITKADNIKSVIYANVTEIETNESNKEVNRLRITRLDLKELFVEAKIYILATGGIEIPRLLLLSNRNQSVGLGNQYDLVGRYFMEHLHFWSGYFLPNEKQLFKKTRLYNEIRTIDGVPIICKFSLKEDVLRKEGLPNASIQLIPRVILQPSLNKLLLPKNKKKGVTAIKNILKGNDIGKNLSVAVKNTSDIFSSLSRKLKMRLLQHLDKRRVNIYRLANMAEQVPNPESRVVLSNEEDNLGRLKANLDWQITQQDIAGVMRTQKIIDKEFRNTGLGQLIIELDSNFPPPGLHGGYHHMGTTRMDNNEKKGVVDENCKIHGQNNLYIAGPSVFTTGGYANPTLTLVALAIRLADHIKQRINK